MAGINTTREREALDIFASAYGGCITPSTWEHSVVDAVRTPDVEGGLPFALEVKSHAEKKWDAYAGFKDNGSHWMIFDAAKVLNCTDLSDRVGIPSLALHYFPNDPGRPLFVHQVGAMWASWFASAGVHKSTAGLDEVGFERGPKNKAWTGREDGDVRRSNGPILRFSPFASWVVPLFVDPASGRYVAHGWSEEAQAFVPEPARARVFAHRAGYTPATAERVARLASEVQAQGADAPMDFVRPRWGGGRSMFDVEAPLADPMQVFRDAMVFRDSRHWVGEGGVGASRPSGDGSFELSYLAR